jgi:hypothetical protein
MPHLPTTFNSDLEIFYWISLDATLVRIDVRCRWPRNLHCSSKRFVVPVIVVRIVSLRCYATPLSSKSMLFGGYGVCCACTTCRRAPSHLLLWSWSCGQRSSHALSSTRSRVAFTQTHLAPSGGCRGSRCDKVVHSSGHIQLPPLW